jgi:hypothetical protein
MTVSPASGSTSRCRRPGRDKATVTLASAGSVMLRVVASDCVERTDELRPGQRCLLGVPSRRRSAHDARDPRDDVPVQDGEDGLLRTFDESSEPARDRLEVVAFGPDEAGDGHVRPVGR